jgi:hypothetical protein
MEGEIKDSSEKVGKSWARKIPLVSAVIRIQQACVCELSRVLYREITVDTTAKLLGRWSMQISLEGGGHGLHVASQRNLGIEGGAEFLAGLSSYSA